MSVFRETIVLNNNMNEEIEDWVQRSGATLTETGEMPKELFKRLQYVAAIVADAGALFDEPLLLFRAPDKKVKYAKIGEELVVGREKPATLVFKEDLHLSRQHFRIRKGADGEHFEDLTSSNGTFVNGIRIESRELCDGDIIEAGRQVFVFLRRRG